MDVVVYVRGCRLLGATTERIVIAPLVRPDPPSPATARPTTNIVEDCAAPHRAEPISKIQRKARNVYFNTDFVYIFPASGWRAQLTKDVSWWSFNIRGVLASK